MKTAREILSHHIKSDLPTDKNVVLGYVETMHIIAAMEEYANQSKWISVKDRMPENDSEILVYSKSLESVSNRTLRPYACYYYDVFKSYGDKISQEWLNAIDISHWQPIPEGPKE